MSFPQLLSRLHGLQPICKGYSLSYLNRWYPLDHRPSLCWSSHLQCGVGNLQVLKLAPWKKCVWQNRSPSLWDSLRWFNSSFVTGWSHSLTNMCWSMMILQLLQDEIFSIEVPQESSDFKKLDHMMMPSLKLVVSIWNETKAFIMNEAIQLHG
jgi:hypothetical protein